MSWKTRMLDILRDVLRFGVAGCIILDGILLALFSLWFVYKFVWQLQDYLSRTLFGSPW